MSERADLKNEKRLWRCLTHRREPQTIPIVATDDSCRVQVLGWFDEVVERDDTGKVTARSYRDPRAVVPEVTPAEALTVLLPDVDWEQLRALIGYLLDAEGFGEWNHDVAPLIRLLAVYDGKDG